MLTFRLYWLKKITGLCTLSMDFKSKGKTFILRGGTSLSKGHKLINRFSEDLDLLIDPPENMSVAIGRNQDKEPHRKSRADYFNWLAENIKIRGISNVERDKDFDDEKFRSGGIRLSYPTELDPPEDVKPGILLEVGFDQISPNTLITISSWAYDYAKVKVKIIDNRAKSIPCYNPGYTLVEVQHIKISMGWKPTHLRGWRISENPLIFKVLLTYKGKRV